jgi:hypothetical protein
MSELPIGDDHQVIRLGDQIAVVVPIEEYRRLREVERRARLAEQIDAEEAEALAEYRAAQRAGTVTAVPHEDVRKRFGLGSR